MGAARAARGTPRRAPTARWRFRNPWVAMPAFSHRVELGADVTLGLDHLNQLVGESMHVHHASDILELPLDQHL
jgi:hypothetical protein